MQTAIVDLRALVSKLPRPPTPILALQVPPQALCPDSPAHWIVGCGDRKEFIARPSVCAKRYPRYCFAVRVLFWAPRLISSDIGLFCFATVTAWDGVCKAVQLGLIFAKYLLSLTFAGRNAWKFGNFSYLCAKLYFIVMAGSNFVDYVKIFARSGHGGAGSCHFRREKFVAFGGPDGGDGGKGGSIILQGDSQYWTLIHLKYKRHQFAEDGENGHGARSTGADAKDIIIPVPLGTVAKQVFTDEETGETYTEVVGEVTEHGEQLVLLKGGRGGLGNWHFRTATNQTPRYAQPGEDGQEGAFILELKVLADVGLVGFPNAGKSTLLSVVSAAKPKIANYAFTTLEPNLGIVSVRDDHSFVMADIPGIIEGAHEGRGLGTRFLRHIERNSVLLFMIPADSDDIAADYDILLGELTQYNPELLDKQRLLAITKCDMLDDELIEQMRAHLPEGIESIFISSVANMNITQLKDMLWRALQA